MKVPTVHPGVLILFSNAQGVHDVTPKITAASELELIEDLGSSKHIAMIEMR
jgi:hypothetical protein